MKTLREFASIATLLAQGCASQPMTPARALEPKPQLIRHAKVYPQETAEQVESSIDSIRDQIAAVHGSRGLFNAQIYCEMSPQAIECMVKQTEAISEMLARRAAAIRGCYHASEDPAVMTVDIDCFLSAISSTNLSPLTQEAILECRRDILTCYIGLIEPDTRRTKINPII